MKVILLLSITLVKMASSKVLDWPGSNLVGNADESSEFSTNLSGLFYENNGNLNDSYMYAIMNDPSTLYKLYWSGKNWLFESGNWSAGKTLHYTNGKGNPDTEDLTMTNEGTGVVYVASEKDNDDDNTKRISILSFDTTDASTSLTATNEWILNELNDISTNSMNGIEAITWISDKFLTSGSFYDANTKSYDPKDYPNHGGGLFFVGMEENGNVYVYALNHKDSTATQITSFSSGEINIMSLYFDSDSGYLWAGCDNSCDGRMNVFSLVKGSFANVATYNRPSTLPNYNIEGYAVLPDSECSASSGMKAVFWADDDCDNGHAIYQDTIPCGQFIKQ